MLLQNENLPVNGYALHDSQNFVSFNLITLELFIKLILINYYIMTFSLNCILPETLKQDHVSHQQTVTGLSLVSTNHHAKLCDHCRFSENNRVQENSDINPFTAPACKISGLKDALTCVQMVCIFSGTVTLTFSAVCFDESPFTYQCEKE